MKLNIQKKILDNISKDAKISEVKGLVLHSSPDMFNKTIDELYEEIKTKNKEVENYGYHYLVEGKKIYQLLEEDSPSRLVDNNKLTYISKSLFGDDTDNQVLSIFIVVNEKQDYVETETTLTELIISLLKAKEVYPIDTWRGFDLDKGNYGPFHMLSKVIYEKYINELRKFVPDPPPQPEGGPDEEEEKPQPETKTPENPEEKPKFISPFEEVAKQKELSINDYVNNIFKDNSDNPQIYASKFQPWDKDRTDTKVQAIEGDLKTKETPFGNTLQYKITENVPMGLDHCEQAADFLEAIETPKETMFEPIYPDLITPPGDNIHIADGFSSTAVQSDSNTPLTAEELEKRQKTFDFSQFNNMQKVTKGRPVNTEDPFPVDDQIKKLEEHFPKVKIDKVTYNFKDTNHPNSEIGNAMAKNYSMCYDMVTEIAKRTEQRLVKLENNLATVMRNMFRLSSRVNINCVYYGGQSVYGKYKCIRCVHDDRINDGAIVTIDQCMNCTRYEPILGQVYAILDETGSNIVQVMDDLQMSYMELEDYKNLTSVSDYHKEPLNAKVDQHSQDKPKQFIEDEWKDTKEEVEKKQEELKKKQEQSKAEENKEDKSEEDKDDKNTDTSKEESKEPEKLPNGFKMDWTPVALETQSPHVNKYENEKLKAEKKAVSSDTEGIDREIYTDSREEAVENERLEFDIKDYEFPDFGNVGSGIAGSAGGFAAEARNKIVAYVKEAVSLCEQGKAKYSQDYRYNHLEKAINGINYWDCSSLTQKAYEAAGISGIGTNTKTQFPFFLDANGGTLIPLANVSEALPGDFIWFTDQNPKPEQTREGLQKTDISKIPHVGIYMGDGMYGHSSYAHEDSTKDIVIAKVESNKKAFCFGRPKALIDLDQQFGQGLSGNAHWSREYHGITDEWWNKAAVADSNVKSLVSNMEKYNYKDLIINISQKKGFDPYLTAAIAAIESSGDPRGGGKYAGLLQVQGHYGSTSREGIADNIEKGLDMILKKRTYLKQKGWIEDNVHVLVSAFNSGEGTVGGAKNHGNLDLSTVKIPALGDSLYGYVKSKNPGWNPTEKQTYGVKVLRAYNAIYSNNYLGLPQEQQGNAPTFTGEFIRPVPQSVSSPFGMRIHPITGQRKMHNGVDFRTPMGYSIKATASGKVLVAKNVSGYGNAVYLDHGNGITSRYAHMSKLSVSAGQQVAQGTEVGKCGSTGNSTGPHLHFEIRRNEKPEDPMKLVKNY